MRVNGFYAALGAVVIAAATPAAATVINFDSIGRPGEPVFFQEVLQDGFQFTNSSDAPDAFLTWPSQSDFNADRNGYTAVNNYAASTNTVSRIDGGLFDFTSIDLADVADNQTGDRAQIVDFSFTDALGHVTTATANVDNLPGLQRFVFNEVALASVSWTARDYALQSDNIGVDSIVPSAVPEPTSWAMMIGGFGLVGGAMRRRGGSGVALA